MQRTTAGGHAKEVHVRRSVVLEVIVVAKVGKDVPVTWMLSLNQTITPVSDIKVKYVLMRYSCPDF